MIYHLEKIKNFLSLKYRTEWRPFNQRAHDTHDSDLKDQNMNSHFVMN